MLMYEYYRGHAGDTGGYGVSIYVHCNRLGFVDGWGGYDSNVKLLDKLGLFTFI